MLTISKPVTTDAEYENNALDGITVYWFKWNKSMLSHFNTDGYTPGMAPSDPY